MNNFTQDLNKENYVTNLQVDSSIYLFQNNLKKFNPKKIINKIEFIENADPGYDFIFSCRIKGLITAFGGPNSHMSIRCNEFSVPAAIGIGEKKYFGSLEIKALKCQLSENNEFIDAVAYLQVKDLDAKDNNQVFLFNGWTFASNPTFQSIDHPIYDLWITGCENI